MFQQAWAVAQLIRIFSTCDALVLIPSIPGMVVPSCDPSAWEVRMGRPEIQGYPWLHSEFEVRLDYRRPCLKNANRK